MTDMEKSNVVLLPQSIDFYQIELTRMLETDRFAEAAGLLRFLIGCESGDPRADEEWVSLLNWLETTFPGVREPNGGGLADAGSGRLDAFEEQDEDADEEESEADLLKRRLNDKADADDAFVLKLLEKLERASALPEQLIALEQLALIRGDDERIEAALIKWLQTAPLSPIDQFTALQALGRRGVKTEITLERPGGQIRVKPNQTPQNPEQFPEAARKPISVFAEASGEADPMLTAYARQTWFDFLAFYYGTDIYDRLKSGDEGQSRIWAAALHKQALAALQGEGAATDEELYARYGLLPEQESDWRDAQKALKAFTPGI